MRTCPSGKIMYMSQEVAEEALIQNKVKNHHSISAGPINVYQCSQCHCYHFTSKGQMHPMLADTKVQARIQRLQQGSDWEDKLK